MRKLIPRKILFKKASLTILVFVILGLCLFAYNVNQDFIRSFRPYYIKSYTALVSHRADDYLNSEKYLAVASGILMNNDNLGYPSVNQQEQNLAETIPVLLYHGIIDKPDGTNVLLENFKDQMFALKKTGWQTVSIEDFYAFMQGKKELSEKSFLLKKWE